MTTVLRLTAWTARTVGTRKHFASSWMLVYNRSYGWITGNAVHPIGNADLPLIVKYMI
jgi:hypothetical protein